MDAMTRDPKIMLLGGIQYIPYALTPNTVELIPTLRAFFFPRRVRAGTCPHSIMLLATIPYTQSLQGNLAKKHPLLEPFSRTLPRVRWWP